MKSGYDLGGLEALEGFPFRVFVSAGGDGRGRAVAERAHRTVAWLDSQVGMPETPPLFVLSADDWEKAATTPLYGMPHVDSDRIVVGQEPAPFWSAVTGVITPLVGSEELSLLQKVYGDPPELGSFADLLVSHELSHLAHGQSWPAGPVGFWMKELAANLGLHGYVTEVEPAQSARLETVVEVIWSLPDGHWPVRDLLQMRDSLAGDGSNYVWFEFGLQVLAKRLWQTAGTAALQTVVTALRGPELDLGQAVDLLAELDPAVAQAIRDWPRFPPGMMQP